MGPAAHVAAAKARRGVTLSGGMILDIVNSEAGFLALREAWGTLWAAQIDALGSQTFEWCWICLQTIAKPRGRLLHIVVGREGSRVVLIWPLVLARRHAWTVLRPLGTESTEYAAPLVASGPDADAIVADMWAWLRVKTDADLICAPFVPNGTPLHGAISSTPGWAYAHQDIAMRVEWEGVPTWDAYYRTLSAKRMSNIRRCRNRLSEIGVFTSEPVETSAELQEVVRWVLAQKRVWRKRNARTGGEWVDEPDYEACILAIARDDLERPLIGGWALRLGGALIAASIKRVGSARLEAFIFAYDHDYARFGPGEILLLDELKWAFDNRRSLDFRIGAEHYKAHFRAQRTNVVSYDCARTPLGASIVALKRGKAALAALSV
jgi:CelD/BcsL family acetyltransferase involved in cellulose biosynthesis